jgi:hypothetical protein
MSRSRQHDTIDLEFQPNVQRILVPKVNIETTTVDEALAIFSDKAGIVRTSIKRAIPYHPVFTSGNLIFFSHVTVSQSVGNLNASAGSDATSSFCST